MLKRIINLGSNTFKPSTVYKQMINIINNKQYY